LLRLVRCVLLVLLVLLMSLMLRRLLPLWLVVEVVAVLVLLIGVRLLGLLRLQWLHRHFLFLRGLLLHFLECSWSALHWLLLLVRLVLLVMRCVLYLLLAVGSGCSSSLLSLLLLLLLLLLLSLEMELFLLFVPKASYFVVLSLLRGGLRFELPLDLQLFQPLLLELVRFGQSLNL